MKRIFTSALLAAFAFGVAGTARAEEAATLYNSKCSVCHGKDGKGETTMGKKFGIKPFEKSMSEADRAKLIADGKGKMPAYKSKLSEAEITSLAKYVGTLK